MRYPLAFRKIAVKNYFMLQQPTFGLLECVLAYSYRNEVTGLVDAAFNDW